jgi:hypothetical protein
LNEVEEKEEEIKNEELIKILIKRGKRLIDINYVPYIKVACDCFNTALNLKIDDKECTKEILNNLLTCYKIMKDNEKVEKINKLLENIN